MRIFSDRSPVPTCERRSASWVDAPFFFLDLVQARPQNGHGAQFVLQLRAFILDGNHHTGRQVGDSYGSGILLDILTARTGRAKNINFHIGLGDFHIHIFHFGQYGHGGSGGVNSTRRLGRRDSLDAVHTRTHI